MKLHFLGGADEVGASSVLVETEGCRILVDAGIRMGDARKDKLPDLARATDLGGLDAVILTHAHLDHSGALPLLHGAFPKAEIWTSEATLSLLRVLLLDAVKIMEMQADREDEIPLYPLAAVESLLAKTHGTRFLEPIRLGQGRVTATLFPAGHVLGAAAVGLETPEGRVLITGDVSIGAQLTVSGMPLPRFSPDLVVCESTYGARLHASRRAEEQRLVNAVFSALREGRKVLIPAFALGRAQEVLLILRRALAQEDAPKTVVWADGMVRAVCQVYSQHPEYLASSLKKRVEQERNPFYTADGRIRPVTSPAEREAILSGPPCVIVASSGMLSGGPSSFYASHLAQRDDALIAITGYQDEEAPGRKLQDLALGRSVEIFLNNRAVKVSCQVETYGLSAHADGQELLGMLGKLKPVQVALVHGDAEARSGLADMLAGAGLDVVLPATGESLEVAGRSGAPRMRKKGIGRGRPFEQEALVELHGYLWKQSGSRRSYLVRDFAEIWWGSDGVPEDLAPVHARLRENSVFFAPDARRPFHFRPVDPATASSEDIGPARDEAGRMEQNAALAEVDACLGDGSGLYKRGAERETWTIRLYFHFPDVARLRHAELMSEIEVRTGWAVKLHSETHLGALEQELRACLPSASVLVKSPSVFKDEQCVSAVVSPLPDDLKEICASFAAKTGFALRLKGGVSGTAKAKKAFDAQGRMEINLAFRAIEEAFSGKDVVPGRKSKKNDAEGVYIELSFISPELGRRHQKMLDDLEEETNWRIHIGERVDQQAVLRIATELIPQDWNLTRNPGLDLAGRKVLLKFSTPVPDEDLLKASEDLCRQTGFGFATR